jgi:rSAM/selenodomain-associated transferase 2
MPVLNEAGVLRQTLCALELTGREELIVVDGGSTDATASIAREFTARVYATRRGRAGQMNYGAARAGGELLFFLHADCVPPPAAFGMIRVALEDRKVAGGAFDLGIDHPALKFRVVERGANLRSRLTGVPYGDQGLFMRRETFERLGGFREMPLMEDIEIGRRLGAEGRVVFLRPRMTASPRRWLAEGALYTTLRDWRLALLYTVFRARPEGLARHYRDVR